MKHRLTGVLTAFMMLLSVSCFAQNSKIKFTEYDLDNGLHVILHQDNSIPTVVVGIMYHVGAKNEKSDRTGFAHFFEHQMFERTEFIPRGEFMKIISRRGGFFNANTTQDRTFYYEQLTSNELELGLWLESERMLHLKLDPNGLKMQKKVVVEEKKQRYYSQPYGTFMEETLKRAFKKHPYQWTTIGDTAHIQAATDEDFMDFYKTFYVPNNAAICIAGNFKMDEAKALVKKYFNDIPRGKNPIRVPDKNMEPKLEKEIRDTIYDNIQLPLIVMGYRVPAVIDRDFKVMQMINSLLTDGNSSRLYRALVDEQQKSVQIQAFPFNHEHPGLNFMLKLCTATTNPKDLEESYEKEIDKIRNNLISNEELQKLKNNAEMNYLNSISTIQNKMEQLLTFYTFHKNTNLINNEFDIFKSITAEDIKRVANQYFNKNNRVVLYYLPKKAKK